MSARVLGSWSTGGALPCRGGGRPGRYLCAGLAKLEHNGPWRWDLAEQPGGLVLTLSGPTDADHQWLAVLRPGETFCTVPATVALGLGWQAALGELTKHRRLARRPHPDNQRLPVIFNDYMNTLMGDPTTERSCCRSIDAAADAGAEVVLHRRRLVRRRAAPAGGTASANGSRRDAASRSGIDEVLDRIRGARA